jgi:cytochrome c biogenesis protein CcmG/thiol:disulfide interchange protein DsbE
VSDPATRPDPGSAVPDGRPPGVPRRRIVALVGVAALTTLAVVAIVALTQSSSAVAVGQPVPNISGTTLDGSTVDLAALRGHPVVINFWGPTCVPCREEMPLLAQKLAEHGKDGLVILGVLTYDPVEAAREFAAQYGGTWQTVVDPGGAIRNAYRVVGRPQSYFVDPNGVLQSIQIGYLTDADFERQFAKIAQTAGGS